MEVSGSKGAGGEEERVQERRRGLLDSAGHQSQALGIERDGRQHEKKNVAIGTAGPLCCTAEIGTTWQINPTLMKTKVKKKRADESSTLPEAFVYLFLRKGPWEKGLKRKPVP